MNGSNDNKDILDIIYIGLFCFLFLYDSIQMPKFISLYNNFYNVFNYFGYSHL